MHTQFDAIRESGCNIYFNKQIMGLWFVLSGHCYSEDEETDEDGDKMRAGAMSHNEEEKADEAADKIVVPMSHTEEEKAHTLNDLPGHLLYTLANDLSSHPKGWRADTHDHPPFLFDRYCVCCFARNVGLACELCTAAWPLACAAKFTNVAVAAYAFSVPRCSDAWFPWERLRARFQMKSWVKYMRDALGKDWEKIQRQSHSHVA